MSSSGIRRGLVSSKPRPRRKRQNGRAQHKPLPGSNVGDVPSEGTAPELAVQMALDRLRYKYLTNFALLPGSPDVVLLWHKVVIFVNGCYWHHHARCRFATRPKSNSRVWKRKFLTNQRRDRKQHAALIALGWQVVVVWGCETGRLPIATDSLCALLRRRVTKARQGLRG